MEGDAVGGAINMVMKDAPSREGDQCKPGIGVQSDADGQKI